MTMTFAKGNPDRAFWHAPLFRWGLIALIQLGLIALPLVERLSVQTNGQEVTLELLPVDPRDLLRGDYIILNISAGTLPPDLPGAKGLNRAGQTVYVSLEKGSDGIARPVKISETRQEAGPLALKGTVRITWDEQMRINYGMDAFFLPEGAGKAIERLPQERVKLVISLHPDGRSLPLRLLIDGKPFVSDRAF